MLILPMFWNYKMGVHSMLSVPPFKHPLLKFILTLGGFPIQSSIHFFKRPLDDPNGV